MRDTGAIVRAALDLLKPHLRRFVEHRLRIAYGPQLGDREGRMAPGADPDISALVGVMVDHWSAAFAGALAPRARALAHEIREARNAWAHERVLSMDRAYRAVDSVELLLREIHVHAEDEKLGQLKREIRAAQALADAPAAPAATPAGMGGRSAGPRTSDRASAARAPLAADLRGKRLRIAPHVLREGNPRRPDTHGWLAFEVLRRAEGGTLRFEDYERRLFSPAPDIALLAARIPGVPNAYQDLKHIRHDIALGRVYVED